MTRKESRDAIYAASEKDLTGYVVELCKAHLRLQPKSVSVWVDYGRALKELSRFEEAKKAFDKALVHSEGDRQWESLVFTSLGDLNKRRGDYVEAEKWYLKAIEATPEHDWNYIFLGVLTFRCGDLALAEQRLQDAIECGGDGEDEAYFNLGGVLTAQERYKEAQQCYLRAIELCPDYKLAKLRLRDVNKILKMKTPATDSSVAEAPSE